MAIDQVLEPDSSDAQDGKFQRWLEKICGLGWTTIKNGGWTFNMDQHGGLTIKNGDWTKKHVDFTNTI